MPEFTVTWRIQVDAETHESAARRAKAIVQRTDTTADVFEVTHPLPGAAPRIVDLSVEDGRLPECDRAARP